MHGNRNPHSGQFVGGAILTVEERLWPKVNKDGPVPERYPELGPCWDWTGSKTPAGYGLLSVGGVATLAHRINLVAAIGRPLVKGERSLHVCDRPSCVRNDTVGYHDVRGVLFPRRGHLFLGDSRANGLDMSQKGRSAVQQHPELIRRGAEYHPIAVLNVDKVREIRRMRAGGMILKDIAAHFDINLGTVWQVVSRKTWAYVE